MGGGGEGGTGQTEGLLQPKSAFVYSTTVYNEGKYEELDHEVNFQRNVYLFLCLFYFTLLLAFVYLPETLNCAKPTFFLLVNKFRF